VFLALGLEGALGEAAASGYILRICVVGGSHANGASRVRPVRLLTTSLLLPAPPAVSSTQWPCLSSAAAPRATSPFVLNCSGSNQVGVVLRNGRQQTHVGGQVAGGGGV
jgi:hypothetical protein